MALVVLREGESGESLVKRFQTAVQRSGLLREVKERRFFRPKSEKKRMAVRLAIRRAVRREHRQHSSK